MSSDFLCYDKENTAEIMLSTTGKSGMGCPKFSIVELDVNIEAKSW